MGMQLCGQVEYIFRSSVNIEIECHIKQKIKHVIKLIHELVGWVKRLTVYMVAALGHLPETKYHPSTDILSILTSVKFVIRCKIAPNFDGAPGAYTLPVSKIR
jgi:hypothetical protein